MREKNFMLEQNEIFEWLKKAEDDLLAGKAIIDKSAPAWTACFHAQQSAEKSLKAAQIFFLRDIQKEHDLEVLLNSLKSYFNTEIIRQETIKLTDYYVTTRYPGIKESEITLQDASIAIELADKILNFIKKQIKK